MSARALLAVRARRDDRQDTPDQQVFAEPFAVIALIGRQRLGLSFRERATRWGRRIFIR